jgi:hypothetical protein
METIPCFVRMEQNPELALAGSGDGKRSGLRALLEE